MRRQFPPTAAGRFVGGVFGFVFAGIGLSVLGFLWGSPFGAFHSPPLFFRVFGSFIAIAFVAMGGATAFAAITAGKSGGLLDSVQNQLENQLNNTSPADTDQSQFSPGYSCPQCGAPLTEDTDVSPHGDVRCVFCKCWFNIHGKDA